MIFFVFARKFDAVAGFKFGVLSKAERGFVLADAHKTVFKAEPVSLEESTSVAASLKAIALSCIRQFRLNEDALLRRRRPDALHQTRVALRRLRSAFSLFKAVLPGDEPERLKQELRCLAAVLGEARNVDVLLAKAYDKDLAAKLKTARAAAYRDAIDALDSSRARALMLDLVHWLECGDDLARNGDASTNAARDFAARILEKQRKRLKRDGNALAKTDDDQRHEVRKDAKKFRYAAEFFGSLFKDKRGARRHKKFLEAMEALQDELGALNDLATGPDVLEKHGLRDHPARDSIVSHGDKVALIVKAQVALDEVLDTKRFWK
ncbi:CHAD domain-containing protein [Rhizobium sp. P38BS-XIX]|uniref:CHAD domain-containing protein n=1 Tax=Rhizobium sp. P38BS-XIX TaxID=2726740 RepID=UPI001FEE9510|nr:CHAD domain-containing protein [Rhizobium sp. P38BS-XIX]